MVDKKFDEGKYAFVPTQKEEDYKMMRDVLASQGSSTEVVLFYFAFA